MTALLNTHSSGTQQLLCCALLQNDEPKIYLSIFCWIEAWKCSKLLLNSFSSDTTSSLETVTADITVLPVAWKTGVLRWEDRSSPLSIATDWYWLLCPHQALHIEEISFLLPYKAESLECTLFTPGNARITNSISSTAVPSFIHLATQNKHSSFMKLYLRHLDNSTESSLLYQSESSYMMQGKTY